MLARSLSPVFLTLALAAGLPAQGTAVFPGDHATVNEGSTFASSFPFSYGVSRVMLLYEAWDVQVPAGRQITRIGFREDNGTQSIGRTLQLQVRIGQTEKTAANAVSNFDGNWFGAPTTVYGPGLFTMPDMNNILNPNPDGRMIWVPLTPPYTYDPSKNLLIDFQVFANNGGNTSWSYRLDRATFLSPRTTGPQGCPHSGNQIPELHSDAAKVGSNWINRLTRGPANTTTIMFVTLGAPLVPQYPLGPVMPGIDPACQGQLSLLNPLFSLTSTTNGSGNYNWVTPIPNSLIWNDFTISSQAVCFDFFVPGGVVVSNGDQMEIGIDPQQTMIYASGNANATNGSVAREYGLITFFDHN